MAFFGLKRPFLAFLTRKTAYAGEKPPRTAGDQGGYPANRRKRDFSVGFDIGKSAKLPKVTPPRGGSPPGRAQQIWSVCCIILRVFSMYFDGKLFCVTKNVAGERGLHSQYASNPCQSMTGFDFSAMGRLRPATVCLCYST